MVLKVELEIRAPVTERTDVMVMSWLQVASYNVNYIYKVVYFNEKQLISLQLSAL